MEHLPAALFVIFRIGGLAIYAPVIGAQIVPVQGRALFAIVLGFAIYPILYTQNLVSAPLNLDMWTLVPLLCLEILIGMVIGFIASLPMLAVQISGSMMGQQMGLGFARIFNPTIGNSADVIGQLLFFMALASFLLIGGLDAIVLAVLNTFHHMPLGTNIMDGSLLEMLLGAGAVKFAKYFPTSSRHRAWPLFTKNPSWLSSVASIYWRAEILSKNTVSCCITK